MVFINAEEILETVSMIRSENLDVRAVTMGISLADCAAGETRRTAERIHAKIVRRAGRLVKVAAELQEKYGVPIVNRRVSVTPIADVVGSDDPQAYVEVAHALDAAANEVGIDFLGGTVIERRGRQLHATCFSQCFAKGDGQRLSADAACQCCEHRVHGIRHRHERLALFLR